MFECTNFGNCEFIKKYLETKNLACKGFIRMYCKGDKQDICKRKEYNKMNGCPPPVDMLPSGQIFQAN